MSNDYHDYVFRNGKLIGEFEEMYKNSTVIPWHQDQQDNWIDVRLTKEIFNDIGSFDEIHDFGCGTGHYLGLMAKHLGSMNGNFFGYDISNTACKIAKKNFPSYHFSKLDLTLNAVKKSSLKLDRLFMLRGTLWYVTPKIDFVVRNISNSMQGSDKLLIVQNFPPLSTNFVGKEVLPNYCAIIEHFSEYFVVERYVWYESQSNAANDNWFIGLFSIKEN